MTPNKFDIAKYLDNKGVKHALQGFDYLITAITLCAENPEYKHSICHIYSEVGKKHNTTGSRAERSIRHAIERSNTKTANGEFIAVAVDHFRYLEGENHDQ